MAFASASGNLVAGDTNGCEDVFLWDRMTRLIERISLAPGGTESNGPSVGPCTSADGGLVAFESDASNLVGGDTNSRRDVFVYDRQAKTTERVSISSSGQEGDGDSYSPSISGDGRFVSFLSKASNLVLGDGNGATDVFVYDRQTKTTERVSVSSTGQEGNRSSEDYPSSISGNGRFVAFVSEASNLVTSDTNGCRDVFVRDRQTNTTEIVSVSSTGQQGNAESLYPSISADGRYVAMASAASNLVPRDTVGKMDVFVYDRKTNTIERVSVSSTGREGNGPSYSPSISVDGRLVVFASNAWNLVSGSFGGLFVYDRTTDTVCQVKGVDGGDPSISADGRYVAYASKAVFVSGDNNDAYDVFLWDRKGTADRTGNSIDHARKLAAVSINKQQSVGEVVNIDDAEDWFSFALKVPGKVKIGLSNLSGNADLYLYNAKGTLLKFSRRLGTKPDTISLALSAGKYFVQVFTAEFVITKYTLTLLAT